MARDISDTEILVTDAYSSSNIGDLELVVRSLAYARQRHPGKTLCLLAVDEASFTGFSGGVPVAPKLFDRKRLLGQTGLRRLMRFARWAVQLGLLLLTAAVPGPTNRKRLASAAADAGWVPAVAKQYVSATSFVAVGGGYLGDQYAGDSALTLFTWWWAGRVSCDGETMPISIEIERPVLRLLLRLAARRTRIRVRDAASAASATRAGVTSELVPDLAFLNAARHSPSDVSTAPVLIALVGSDYLSAQEQVALMSSMVNGLVSVFGRHQAFRSVAMHRSLVGSAVGADGAVATLLIDSLRRHGCSDVEEFVPSSYEELCRQASQSRCMISARMHAGIAALCGGAPTALLAYERKHSALMADMQLSEFCEPITAPSSDLQNLLRRLKDADPELFASAALMRRRLVEKALK